VAGDVLGVLSRGCGGPCVAEHDGLGEEMVFGCSGGCVGAFWIQLKRKVGDLESVPVVVPNGYGMVGSVEEIVDGYLPPGRE